MTDDAAAAPPTPTTPPARRRRSLRRPPRVQPGRPHHVVWLTVAMAMTAPILTGGATQGPTTSVAAGPDLSGSGPASWLDISSRVGVVALCLFLAYLIIFSGRLRSDREFKELTATHQRELEAKDDRIKDLRDRNAALFSDRDAWKLAAGNALEGLQAFERSTAASLEEKSMVIAVVEALQQIAQTRGGDGGTNPAGGRQ